MGTSMGFGFAQRPDDYALSTLVNMKAALEQERAAAMSTSGSNAPQLTEIDARLAVVNKQIDEMKTKRAAETQAEAEAAKRKAASLSTRVYDVREIIGVPAEARGVMTADQRAAMSELMRALLPLVKADATVTSFNGMIVVRSDEECQKNVQAILDMLKAQYKQGQEGRKEGAK
jgi:hypothetical protein